MGALLQTAEGVAPTGYGAALVQALVALVAVCVLAWVVLRWGARRGIGVASGRGAIRVVERVPLDTRRSLLVVRAKSRVFLLGVGEGAAPSLVAELDPHDWPPREAPPGSSFAQVLRRTLAGARPPAPDASPAGEGPDR